jgi:iron complex transport system ATP-binding protein
MSPMMQARGLQVRFGERKVLNDATLSVKAGRWVALVGPNGAGKSTLMRCMAGLLTPAAGEVFLQGRRLSDWSVRQRARAMSWMGQDVVADPDMSVRDAVSLGRLPYQGWLGAAGERARDRQAIELALLDTDMNWAAQRNWGALSGGERQRVSLARALAVQASVLMLDEPVAHLDAPHQRLLAQVLRREASLGRSVISVLHELPLALQADELAIMREGQILMQGSCDDPAVHRALESVFDHALAITRVNDRWAVLPQF